MRVRQSEAADAAATSEQVRPQDDASAIEQPSAPAAQSDGEKQSTPSTSIKRPPDEWAQQAYPVSRRITRALGGRLHHSRWQHDAAAALHGWHEHAHHEGAPIKLTGEAYYFALVAASEPNASGDYIPHAAALSPHAPIAKRS